MSTIEVTDETFPNTVLNAEKPVLVDFWATWCAPCRQVAPVLEALSDEYEEHLTIAKLDVDQSPMVSGQMRIRSIPTMVLFHEGRAVQALSGAQPKEKIVEFLEQHVPGLKPPTIAAKELAGLLERGLPIEVLDIRAQNDFSRSHIRRSRCVPAETLLETVGALPEGSLVVLVCRTGERSMELASQSQWGGRQVVALQKGLLDWEGDLLPTYSDREEARLEEG